MISKKSKRFRVFCQSTRRFAIVEAQQVFDDRLEAEFKFVLVLSMNESPRQTNCVHYTLNSFLSFLLLKIIERVGVDDLRSRSRHVTLNIRLCNKFDENCIITA